MTRWNRRRKILRFAWLTLSVLVLAITLYEAELPGNRDNIIVMVWLMLVLSFPSGYLVSVLYAAVAMLAPGKEFPPVSDVYVGFVLTWLGFFVAGYVQWFVLLPAVVRKIRHRLGRVLATPPATPPSS